MRLPVFAVSITLLAAAVQPCEAVLYQYNVAGSGYVGLDAPYPPDFKGVFSLPTASISGSVVINHLQAELGRLDNLPFVYSFDVFGRPFEGAGTISMIAFDWYDMSLPGHWWGATDIPMLWWDGSLAFPLLPETFEMLNLDLMTDGFRPDLNWDLGGGAVFWPLMLHFSDRQVIRTPDTGPALALLGLSVLGLMAFPRRFLCRG